MSGAQYYTSPRRRMWGYRGFIISPHVGDTNWQVDWRIRANFWLPRSFIFHGGVEPLKKYIDALIEKDEVQAAAYEDAGQVSRKIFLSDDDIPPERVQVSPARLLAVMFGVDPLEVPANSLIHVRRVQNGDKSLGWANEFFSELVAEGILPSLPIKDVVAQINKEWKRRRPAAEVGQLHTGMSIQKNTKATDSVQRFAPRSLWKTHSSDDTSDEQSPEASSEELLISEHERGLYRERISMIQGEPPFYIRRYIRNQNIIYVARAWSLHGPWEIAYRDESRCVALGIAG